MQSDEDGRLGPAVSCTPSNPPAPPPRAHPPRFPRRPLPGTFLFLYNALSTLSRLFSVSPLECKLPVDREAYVLCISKPQNTPHTETLEHLPSRPSVVSPSQQKSLTSARRKHGSPRPPSQPHPSPVLHFAALGPPRDLFLPCGRPRCPSPAGALSSLRWRPSVRSPSLSDDGSHRANSSSPLLS